MDKKFKDICKLDGYVCKCFKYKDPDPLECRWLIDEETEDKLKKEEEWANDKNIEFDRDTALRVLSDLSHRMYPNHDIFGKKILVITRDNFELVRKKYLDKK